MQAIIIENIRLIDGNGTVSEGQTIVTENDSIVWVGDCASAPKPAQAILIDGTGKTALPGLIEGHAHVDGDPSYIAVLRKSLQRGITTVCSVSANFSGIALRDAIRDGHVRGCANLVAGCTVAPTNGHVRFRDADGPWEVRKVVREMVQAGADFIKTAASGGFWSADENCSVRNYTLEELVALADEAHAWGKPCVVHAHTQPGINNSVLAGIDQIHHGAFINFAGVRAIKDKDLYFMPTLRVTSERNLAAWPDRPWMLAEMKQAQPVHRAARYAHDIGAKIIFGCDYPGSSHGWAVGDSSLWELGELVSCGLSPLEAITAATRTTAEAYRILDSLGTIEAGKLADILIVSADPLADIMVLYDHVNVAMVLKSGRIEYTDEAWKEYYRISDFN